jgi:hypothetical protein
MSSFSYVLLLPTSSLSFLSFFFLYFFCLFVCLLHPRQAAPSVATDTSVSQQLRSKLKMTVTRLGINLRHLQAWYLLCSWALQFSQHSSFSDFHFPSRAGFRCTCSAVLVQDLRDGSSGSRRRRRQGGLLLTCGTCVMSSEIGARLAGGRRPSRTAHPRMYSLPEKLGASIF